MNKIFFEINVDEWRQTHDDFTVTSKCKMEAVPQPDDFDRDATAELWTACQRGDAGTVQEILLAQRPRHLKIHLDWENNRWHGTPLVVAISQGHSDIVLLLLKAGATPPPGVIQPAGTRARRSAALEASGYSVCQQSAARRRCAAIVRNVNSPPVIASVQVNFADPTTVVARCTHQLHQVFDQGHCEYQMRQTFVGALVETPWEGPRRGTPAFLPPNHFLGPQEEKIDTKILAGLLPLKEYMLRVRYWANNGASWCTDWSEWSTNAMVIMPDDTLLEELELAQNICGANFNFVQRMNEFCMSGKITAEILIRSAQTEELESSLIAVHTALDYSERRALVRVLRAKLLGKSYEDYCFKFKYDRSQIVGDEKLVGSPMWLFLKSLKGGMEQHTESMFRLVDSLDQLLSCYSCKDEFMDDIRESLPGMKPAHRRIIWLGIQKETSQNVGTSTASAGGGGGGLDKK